jgi:hypothetical protein
MWDTKFSDESYFLHADNYKENCGEIFFELESFARPAIYCSEYEEINISRPVPISMSPEDSKIIDYLLVKSPFEEITHEEKAVLWRNRTVTSQDPQLTLKLFSSVNRKDPKEISEVAKLVLVKF